MKKYSFWINVFLLIFLLGIGGVIVWATMADNNLEAVKPPPLLIKQNCTEPVNFPALARRISEISKSKNGYFPEGIFSNKNWKERDNFINDWYGKHLKAMSEKSLLDISDVNTEIYRFLWLRSFDHPVFVRIERNQNEIKLFTKELSGTGGYEPGEVLRESSRDLREGEWCNFLKLLRKTDFWNISTRGEAYGTDGAEWVLEAIKNGRYHVVSRWSAKKSEYGAACIYLLKLSGINIDKLGNDLY